MDFVLSEFHLGATYDAIARRRLWQHRRLDVVIVPLIVLALTYLLMRNGQGILLTSITMYAAVWHRGRQNLGVARFYQRGAGGPVSQAHDFLFRGAIYLPMLAGMLAYTHLAPKEYEGNPYFSFSCGAEITAIVGFAAVSWVIAYVIWSFGRNSGADSVSTEQHGRIHPGERWVVFAHAVAFGSGYLLGASNASFLLVLAVHHEVQYLYFTYAMRRGPAGLHAASIDAAAQDLSPETSRRNERTFRTEARCLVSFLTWPVIGFSGAIIGGWFASEWLRALGVGGLLCHYWLDGRIWTRRARG